MKKYYSKLVFIVTLILSCNYVHAQDTSIIKLPPPSSPKEIVIKYGTASFYASKFNGRQTSDGSYYDSEKLTAACNTLPLGTWVKVTNLRNDRSVIVQITDHLHPKNKRLIDMSKSAAIKLNFVAWGLTRVKVEVLGALKKKSKKHKKLVSSSSH